MADVADSTEAPEALTVDSAVSVFESLLSDPEDKEPSETPPAGKKTPAQPDAEEQEADPEPADSDEGESQETEESDSEEGQEPPAALDPSTKVKLKIDGKDVEVTLDEALKGYSRTQDYTRKTQAHAENVRAFDTEREAVRAERAKYANDLKVLEQVIEEARPKEPDWDRLRAEHPDQFADVWAQWQQGEKDRAALHQMREEADRKVADDNLKIRQERQNAEREKLLTAIPAWKDDKVRKADAKAMAEYAETLGFTHADLATIEDHRAFVLLNKAMQFDKAQAKKADAAKRIEVVRTTRPGGDTANRAPVSEQTRALQRLAKTHRVDDLAGVFKTMLPDD